MKKLIYSDEDIKEMRLEWYANIRKTVEQSAMDLFNMGVEMEQISIRDNFVQILDPTKFGYGDKWIIKAPDWDEIETDFGVIKIRKHRSSSEIQKQSLKKERI